MPIDLQPLRDAIRDAEEGLKAPQPTPPVGTVLVWYDRAEKDPDAQAAAIVTQVEGVGKLKLVVFKPDHYPKHYKGVLHVDHANHQQKHNEMTLRNGAWDYPDHVRITKGHYGLHVAMLEKKLATARRQLAEAEEIKAKQESDVAKQSQKK
jgi:hypothetical protein